MPYKDKEKSNAAAKERMKRYRERRKKSGANEDPEWKAAQCERQKQWYSANKESIAAMRRAKRAKERREKLEAEMHAFLKRSRTKDKEKLAKGLADIAMRSVYAKSKD